MGHRIIRMRNGIFYVLDSIHWGAQIAIRSTSSKLTSSPRLSYSPVVRDDSCAAICCATSRRPPFLR